MKSLCLDQAFEIAQWQCPLVADLCRLYLRVCVSLTTRSVKSSTGLGLYFL